MGTYLSTPVTDKTEESGECACTPSDADRHPRHPPSEGSGPAAPGLDLAWGVVDMQGWRKSMEDAHVATGTDGVFGVFDGHGGPEVARFCQLYLVSVLQQQPSWQDRHTVRSGDGCPDDPPSSNNPNPSDTPVGRALASAFHALDRMIADPARREELVRLRAVKPQPGERHTADSIPPLTPSDGNGLSAPESPAEPTANVAAVADPVTAPRTAPPTPENPPRAAVRSLVGSPTATANGEESNERTGDADGDCDMADVVEVPEDDAPKDDDSIEAVGKDEAALEHELEEEELEDEVEEVHPPGHSTSKYSVMFQRLLNMSAPSGQLVVQLTGASPPTLGAGQATTNPAAIASPSASTPSLLRNGRLICNLPDHPIHAGATAIVAVLVGRTLTVANAGDSRAVLCRRGMAHALSVDHKPLDERELNRIRKAGGFVNQFGRVNGNLNLSRSIGDLKYKQVPHLPPSEQMITAEPDIVQVDLGEHDEFLILGCDGIWDCLTNDKAVAYVRSRIDTMSPTQIGVEMLNDIISDDPRTTQGIGGDNMTVMIVDLQPRTRRWRRAEHEAAAEVTPGSESAPLAAPAVGTPRAAGPQ